MNDNLSFILSWLEKRLGRPIAPTADMFVEGGIDSLDFVELMSDLADETGFELDPTLVDDWTSMRTPQGLADGVGQAFLPNG